MKKFIILLYIIGITISVNAQNQTLKDYVQYINNYSSTPVEYIFKLFEQSDIVVIGERDHRDTTQYQLILDILKDPRFAKEIGYVYTEVGCVNRTKDVNKLLCGKYKSDKTFNDALYAYGAVLRYAGWAEFYVMPLHRLPFMGFSDYGSIPRTIPQFITGATREMVPAVKRIEESVDYELSDSFPFEKLSNFSLPFTMPDSTC